MRDASYRDTNFLEVVSRGGPRVRAVEFERLGERDPECVQQLLARVLLTVDARNLFDPADPVVARLLYDGSVFRHECMLAGDCEWRFDSSTVWRRSKAFHAETRRKA